MSLTFTKEKKMWKRLGSNVSSSKLYGLRTSGLFFEPERYCYVIKTTILEKYYANLELIIVWKMNMVDLRIFLEKAGIVYFTQ